MPEITEDLRRRLTEKYMLANTPGYLYRHIASLPQLQRLSRESDLRDIVARIDTLLSGMEKVEQLIDVYALIAMLSLKKGPSGAKALRRYTDSELHWVGEYALYALRKRIPTSEHKVDVQYRQQFSWHPNSTGATTHQPYVPKIL